MLIIIDYRSPKESKEKLKKIGDVVEFSSSHVTYNAISGHPDVFSVKQMITLLLRPIHQKNTSNYLPQKEFHL